eukprot:3280-Heterococcus_DN1.PRE.4
MPDAGACEMEGARMLIPMGGGRATLLCRDRRLVSHPSMQSTCSATIYDPQWDQHLRILVFVAATVANNGELLRKATLPLFHALERAECTTIAAAKELTADAGCLEEVDPKLRSIFLRLVSEAELTATVGCLQTLCQRCAFLVFTAVIDPWEPALCVVDCVAPMDRPLYLLLHDDQVQAADPEDKLYYSIAGRCVCRTIAEAKALSAQGRALLTKGAVFEGVPEAALDRFLQLVTAADLSEADVYNASLPKLYGNIFEQQLQAKLLIEGVRLVDGFTLRACLWGAGCYNMRDAVQLTDTSPCLRNVLPSVKARTLDLLSMYDVQTAQFRPAVTSYNTLVVVPQVVTEAVNSIWSAAAVVGQYIGLYSENTAAGSYVKTNTKWASVLRRA